MSITLYSASVPIFTRMLGNLLTWLDKAEAHAAAKKFEPSVFLTTRLAPDIIRAIIEGRQPPSLSGRRLLRAADLPFDWNGQRVLLGFA